MLVCLLHIFKQSYGKYFLFVLFLPIKNDILVVIVPKCQRDESDFELLFVNMMSSLTVQIF